jgi:hypothetical protein
LWGDAYCQQEGVLEMKKITIAFSVALPLLFCVSSNADESPRIVNSYEVIEVFLKSDATKTLPIQIRRWMNSTDGGYFWVKIVNPYDYSICIPRQFIAQTLPKPHGLIFSVYNEGGEVSSNFPPAAFLWPEEDYVILFSGSKFERRLQLGKAYSLDKNSSFHFSYRFPAFKCSALGKYAPYPDVNAINFPEKIRKIKKKDLIIFSGEFNSISEAK